MDRTANVASLDAMTNPSYLLSEHVHLCVSGGQLVMLDLARNNYLALGESQARLLAGVVAGWPMSAPPGGAARDHESTAIELAETMSARGLLTKDRRNGKAAQQADISSPSRSLREDDTTVDVNVGTRHIAAFCAAAASAAFKLRWVPIGRVVHGVKQRRAANADDPSVRDTGELARLVYIFYQLRPFFFTAANACLFDSLTLIQFLARFGKFPGWVFGVQAAPFGAHCWVQQADVVFNDTVDHVRRYTPIMIV